MFPSNNNNGSNNDQVCFFDQSILHKPFLNDIITTNSKQDHQDPLSFFHFSSPFLSYESALEDDRDVFLQQHHDLLLNHHQQPLRVDDHNTNLSEIFVNMADSSQNDVNMSTKDHSRKKNHTQQIPIRKRASKRDRHSKINTAKGLRDRRMRLSLDVARNFFGLQDMLGYDKASKTVEWLLIQAKQEIKKLEKGLPQMNYNCCASVGAKSASSTSECTEVASGIDVEAAAIRETNISKAAKPDDEAKHNDLNQLAAGSWSSFETGEESGIHSRDMNQSLQLLAPEVEEPSSHQHDHIGNQETMVDNSNLANMGKYWSPYSSIYNCLNWNSNVLLCKCCSISSQTFNSSASHRKPLESSNDHGK